MKYSLCMSRVDDVSLPVAFRADGMAAEDVLEAAATLLRGMTLSFRITISLDPAVDPAVDPPATANQPIAFKTEDGCLLTRVELIRKNMTLTKVIWTDGDLTVESDQRGHPVELDGSQLSGEFLYA